MLNSPASDFISLPETIKNRQNLRQPQIAPPPTGWIAISSCQN
jgi:hypothetical protein